MITTWSVCTNGGPVASGIPSEDVAVSVMRDLFLYAEPWQIDDEKDFGPFGRRTLKIEQVPNDWDGVTLGFELSDVDAEGHAGRPYARCNPERRRECCGCSPGRPWKQGCPDDVPVELRYWDE